MPSNAQDRWTSERLPRLDELESVHARLGEGPGRRWLTEQIDRSYVLVLAAQLQGFFRDLHTEVATFVAAQAPPNIRALVERNLTRDRKLDRGNANPGNIGSDFSRLGIALWGKVHERDRRNATRQVKLEQLNIWRNVIAHDGTPSPADATKVDGTKPTLTYGRKLRRAVVALVPEVDEVVRVEIEAIVGTSPW